MVPHDKAEYVFLNLSPITSDKYIEELIYGNQSSISSKNYFAIYILIVEKIKSIKSKFYFANLYLKLLDELNISIDIKEIYDDLKYFKESIDHQLNLKKQWKANGKKKKKKLKGKIIRYKKQ